ncbi:MerR family transcriptional regulator [Reticulibacter mediterranei]|nr:MerR family transcriptional regulator [Reticulibacter mediterranei]
MNTELTIQQVAERTGLSAHTLRYYERVGLLDMVGRASSGHRRYTEDDLSWLAFLMRLRATGMPIRQMLEYTRLRRQGSTTSTQRLALLEEHQRAVLTHMQELEQHLTVIEAKIDLYKRLIVDENKSAVLDTVPAETAVS